MNDRATTPPRGARPDVRGGTADGATLADRLDGASLWYLEVIESFRVTPIMQGLRLRADGLAALAPLPGQDLMVAVPAEGDTTYRRRYTIRRFDPEASEIELHIVRHDEGPGGRWAASVEVGDWVEAIGPRGKITLVEEADWHLFAGDESGLPAVLAMTEALHAGGRALAVLEVPAAADQQSPRLAEGALVDIHWLHRGGADPGRTDALLGALGDLELPAGRGHAYLTGELRVVAAMRQLLVDRGLEPDQISPKPYWRLGVANAPHGEPLKD
jgi:NADPH-dependent ferric siderophore reductase